MSNIAELLEALVAKSTHTDECISDIQNAIAEKGADIDDKTPLSLFGSLIRGLMSGDVSGDDYVKIIEALAVTPVQISDTVEAVPIPEQPVSSRIGLVDSVLIPIIQEIETLTLTDAVELVPFSSAALLTERIEFTDTARLMFFPTNYTDATASESIHFSDRVGLLTFTKHHVGTTMVDFVDSVMIPLLQGIETLALTDSVRFVSFESMIFFERLNLNDTAQITAATLSHPHYFNEAIRISDAVECIIGD